MKISKELEQKMYYECTCVVKVNQSSDPVKLFCSILADSPCESSNILKDLVINKNNLNPTMIEIGTPFLDRKVSNFEDVVHICSYESIQKSIRKHFANKNKNSFINK